MITFVFGLIFFGGILYIGYLLVSLVFDVIGEVINCFFGN